MGSFDGAEICRLVGLFMLHNLANVAGAHNIGLYQDDGLAIQGVSKVSIHFKI